MLSTKSIEVVRATLPVVAAAIGDITPAFYRSMFAAHPELKRDLFNRGNQAQGDQARALAGAIAAYATILVTDSRRTPEEILTRIAHKHVSLGIVAEQYPIVHEHLFKAIVAVLGEAVTPEVAAAWEEVYWEMANALIAMLCWGRRRARARMATTRGAQSRPRVAGHRLLRACRARRLAPAHRLSRPVHLGGGPIAGRGAADQAIQPDARTAAGRLGHHHQGDPGAHRSGRNGAACRGGVELPAWQRLRGR
jgi:hemoglobin-like flavoprotein